MIHPVRGKPSLSSTNGTTLGGQTVTHIVKSSSRAKNARLEVRAGIGLTVVIPRSYNLDQVSDLIRKKRRWILDKLSKYFRRHLFTELKEHKRGDYIPYLGRRLNVFTRHNPDTAVSVRMEKNRLLVNLNRQNGRLNLVLEW